jgi:hypothetical protein
MRAKHWNSAGQMNLPECNVATSTFQEFLSPEISAAVMPLLTPTLSWFSRPLCS